MNTAKIPVRITLDRWQCSISPFVIRIDPAAGSVVEWVSSDGTVEIAFEGESPFQEGGTLASTAAGEVARSAVLRTGLTNFTRFPYIATVRADLAIVARLNGMVLISPGTSSVPKEVKILQNADGTLRVDPDIVTVYRKKDERISWICDFGRFEINFDKGHGTPFEESLYSAESGLRARSGRFKTGLLERLGYDYSVRVWLPDDSMLEIDPGVVVDDGGGDDGL